MYGYGNYVSNSYRRPFLGSTRYRRYNNYGSGMYGRFKGMNNSFKRYNNKKFFNNKYRYQRYNKFNRRTKSYVPPKAQTAKETKIFTTLKRYVPSFTRAKCTNMLETTNWAGNATPPYAVAANRFFSPTLDWLFQSEKTTEWMTNWAFIEIRAIYITFEIDECILYSVNGYTTVSTDNITPDNPNTPTIAIHWDTNLRGVLDALNYPPNLDAQFSELNGVKFLQRGRPVTLQWHPIGYLKGKKIQTTKLTPGTTLLRDFISNNLSDPYLYEYPRDINCRLLEAATYKWGRDDTPGAAGMLTTLSMVMRMTTYVKLSGNLKYRETSAVDGVTRGKKGLTLAKDGGNELNIEHISIADCASVDSSDSIIVSFDTVKRMKVK